MMRQGVKFISNREMESAGRAAISPAGPKIFILPAPKLFDIVPQPV
jgi:hypothetical protein